jgi:pyruvate kinase
VTLQNSANQANSSADACRAGSVLDAAGAQEIQLLLRELLELHGAMVQRASWLIESGTALHPHFHASANNLLHYLALRDRDVRPLQQRLAALGLSSLGRAESHVLANVEAVLRVLHELAGQSWSRNRDDTPSLELAAGHRLLAEHTEALLGQASPQRRVRIMVTMPREAADNDNLVHDLIRHGMSVMRINCAHDDTAVWSRMIAHARQAAQQLGTSCRVLMDLGGPKLRTGSIEPHAAVMKVRPERDLMGRVIAPARVWLTSEDQPTLPPGPASGTLPVPAAWLAKLRRGDRLTCFDTRDAKRKLEVVERLREGCWLEAKQTVYFAPRTALRLRRGGHARRQPRGIVGSFAAREQTIHLNVGDELVVTGEPIPGRPAIRDDAGMVLHPAHISCSLPQICAQVHLGEPIWFDDGRIGGLIERMSPTGLHVRINQAPAGGAKLGADKGINLPQSDLPLPALADKDLRDLEFVVKHADLVGLSFVNHASDVAALHDHLQRLDGRHLGVVLKIETRRGFENLPELLLAAMQFERAGIMIARGDLAVECGFERLAEIQEEILWICEAAHFPVIWATQVLEKLAKEGIPSRAEITDAAMSNRAECVMLNKGPHILAAVQALDDILRRMEAHQDKKQSMLRQLRLAKPRH